jgi:hypothetical protein
MEQDAYPFRQDQLLQDHAAVGPKRYSRGAS